MNLRPYQEDIIEQARDLMKKGQRSMVIQSPTGSGKTLLTAHMLKSAAERKMASWFVVHRRELIKQSIAAFDGEGVYHGVVANGFPQDSRPLVQIAGVQTLAKRFRHLKEPKMIVWDECHHVAAATWAKLFTIYSKSFHIGLTATPERLDGRGLGKFFKHMIHGPSVPWLIENKYLCDYRIFCPSTIDTKNIPKRMGDFSQAHLAQAADKPAITGDAIREYMKHAPGERAVVFCVSIGNSQRVVQRFNEAGIPAAHVDGETPSEQRDQAIRDFKDGKTKVLSNVDLFGEGFDLPALSCAILLRPTQSLGLYLQQVGRSLRPYPGKSHAVILDHSGLVARHGLPDDLRVWSLEDRQASGAKTALEAGRVKICQNCLRPSRTGPDECPYCGTLFEVKERKVEERAGNLIEMEAEQIQATRKSLQLTFDDLVRQAHAKGERFPTRWAHQMMQRQQARKLGGLRR